TFADDPLRMLRGIRFAAELGFQLAPDLLPAMRAMKSRLSPPVISAERVADELRKMLESPRPKLALELLDGSELLGVIRADIGASAYPEPEKLDELQARVDQVRSERPSRLAPLISGEEIMAIRGIGPGPEVGRIKRRLEELVLDGEVPPDEQAVKDYLATHPQL